MLTPADDYTVRDWKQNYYAAAAFSDDLFGQLLVSLGAAPLHLFLLCAWKHSRLSVKRRSDVERERAVVSLWKLWSLSGTLRAGGGGLAWVHGRHHYCHDCRPRLGAGRVSRNDLAANSLLHHLGKSASNAVAGTGTTTG